MGGTHVAPWRGEGGAGWEHQAESPGAEGRGKVTVQVRTAPWSASLPAVPTPAAGGAGPDLSWRWRRCGAPSAWRPCGTRQEPTPQVGDGLQPTQQGVDSESG